MTKYRATLIKTNFVTKEQTEKALGTFDTFIEADTMRDIFEFEERAGRVRIDEVND